MEKREGDLSRTGKYDRNQEKRRVVSVGSGPGRAISREVLAGVCLGGMTDYWMCGVSQWVIFYKFK